MLTPGCIYLKLAVFLAGALGLWGSSITKRTISLWILTYCEPGSLILDTKNKNNNTKDSIALNLVLNLHILLANPKPGITSFATILTILHKTAGTTQLTSSSQPLPGKEEAYKIHNKVLINFLDSGEEVGVIWMLPRRVAPHLTSNLTFLQCTSLNFTLQWILVHYLTQTRPKYPPTSSTSNFSKKLN